MSRKVQTFASVITNPMNVYNFEIDIPGVNYTLVVESTTYPNQGNFRTITLYYKGEKIMYPAIPENGGTWSIKIPESDDGKILRAFQTLSELRYNQKTGALIPLPWKDISVHMKDTAGNLVFSVVLHGCWILGRSNVNIAANDPSNAWKWDYTFTYQWLEDKLANNKGSEAPM